MKPFRCRYLPISFHISILLLLLLPLPQLLYSLEDDLFYFTSFGNVDEWAQVYDTCDDNFDFKFLNTDIDYIHFASEAGFAAPTAPNGDHHPLSLSLNVSALPNTLSPIEFKSDDAICMVPITANTKKRGCKHFDGRKPERPLFIYNNAPPTIGKYSVSYGFSKNKECVTTTQYSPCYVSPEFGKIRSVVLTAEQLSLRDVREKFTVEEPNQFVSIVNAGSINERFFYEAIFMGSSEPLDCKTTRTSHMVDGKCYPMEIYMYFVDESIPTMARSTILVVPVELSDNENPHFRPIVNAVRHLYEREREFLEENNHLLRDEKMFHHMVSFIYFVSYMGPSHALRHKHHEKDTDIFYIPSSVDVEKLVTSQLNHFERILTYKARTFFAHEKYTNEKGLGGGELALLKNVVRKVGPIFQWELIDNPVNPTGPKKAPPGFLPDEKKTLEEYLTETPRRISDLTIVKTRIQIYLASEAFNNELDLYAIQRNHKPEELPVKLDDAWPTGMPRNGTFEEAVKEYLKYGKEIEEVLYEKRNNATYDEKIQKFKEIKEVYKKNEDLKKKVFSMIPTVIEDACKHFACPVLMTAADIIKEPNWLGIPDKDSYQKHLQDRMDDGKKLAVIRCGEKTGDFQELEDEYFAMGFQSALRKDRDVHDPKHLGVILKEDVIYSWELVYLNNTYLNRKLKTFLDGDDSHDHIFFYHKYKKLEPRYGEVEYTMNMTKKVLLRNLGMKRDEYDKLEQLAPIKFPLEHTFQISWLLPNGGGYYRYKGSSPVPPCYGAGEVLLFKKPITISQEQLMVLTTVPTAGHLKSRDIFNTFGIRRKKHITENKRAKDILFDPRNHQFLGDDGVHKNSVLEYEARKNGGQVYKPNGIVYLVAVCVSFSVLHFK